MVSKSKFPQYKYGGKSSDYIITYHHHNSGKFFKSLADARKYAIKYGLEYAHNFAKSINSNQIYSKEYISAYCLYKYKPEGTSIVHHQQSGDSVIAGYVLIANENLEKNKDLFAWIDVKKTNSRIIDKNGLVIRKIKKTDPI